eukprot:Opistho-2@12718
MSSQHGEHSGDHARGHHGHGHDGLPQQPQLTPAEQEALSSCRKQVLMLAGTAAFLGVVAARRLIVPRLPKEGQQLAPFLQAAGGFFGFYAGLSAGRPICESKLLELENSPIADRIRKRQGLAPKGAAAEEFRGDKPSSTSGESDHVTNDAPAENQNSNGWRRLRRQAASAPDVPLIDENAPEVVLDAGEPQSDRAQSSSSSRSARSNSDNSNNNNNNNNSSSNSNNSNNNQEFSNTSQQQQQQQQQQQRRYVTFSELRDRNRRAYGGSMDSGSDGQ